MRSVCARRGVLAGAALWSLGDAAWTAVPEPYRLLVAGPGGGRLDRVADALIHALTPGLPPGRAVQRRSVGGADGVTGANQFTARGQADDAELLLMPGEALRAWLAGDSRVQFDPALWVPVLWNIKAGVLVGRRPLESASPARPLVLAVSDPLGPAAAALLGLDLLGVPAAPRRTAAELASLMRLGLVDVAYIGDRTTLDEAAAVGAQPLCALSAIDAVPANSASLAKRLKERNSQEGPLIAGFGAAAAASLLDYALLLPPLTPAAEVAMWRAAVGHAAFAGESAGAMQTTTFGRPGAERAFVVLPDGDADLLAYRMWLKRRLQFAPG